jgi:hypothetical protein
MEVLFVNEFLNSRNRQFDWMENEEGESLYRICDDMDFYLNKPTPIWIPSSDPTDGFDLEYWCSIIKMYSDQIHVDFEFNDVVFHVEINEMETRVENYLIGFTADERQAISTDNRFSTKC